MPDTDAGRRRWERDSKCLKETIRQATKTATAGEVAPEVGLEPTTTRLTAACSTIELLWIPVAGADGNDRVSVASKSFSRILCQIVRNPWAGSSPEPTLPLCPRVFCTGIQRIRSAQEAPRTGCQTAPPGVDAGPVNCLCENWAESVYVYTLIQTL